MSLDSDNSRSLVSIRTDIAAIYNDRSPLEQMHVTVMRNLARQKGCDIFSSFKTKEERDVVLRMMTDMIIGTDMINHENHIADLMRYKDVDKKIVKDDQKGGTPQGCLDVMPALLHCADVCNPTKPWSLYEQWTDRIMQEFFDQGDDERMLDLNVTFDKSKIHLPKFQSYFIQGFVRPIFERLNECSDFDGKVLMDNMNDNVNRWKEQLEKSDDAKTNSSSGEKTKDEER